MRPIALVLLLNLPLAGWAQSLPRDVEFRHLTLPGVMNSSQITDVVQDAHGILWVSADGLFRYDGNTFTRYKNLQDSGRVDAKEIKTLFYDPRANRLLLGTHSHGVVLYSYKTDKLRTIPSGGHQPIVSQIDQTSDGRVWVNSFSDGLHYIEKDSLFKFISRRLTRTTCIRADGDQLWVGQLNKLFALKNNVVVDSISLQMPNTALNALTRITTLHVDRSGNLWIGTERSGAIVYDTKRRAFIRYFSPDTPPFFNRINKIYEDSRGLVWILAKSNGMAVYSPTEDRFIRLNRDQIQESSLSGDNCEAITEDHTGIMWIGATGELNQYDPNKLKFRHIAKNPFSPVSLTDNIVRGLYEDRQEKLWIGTDGGTIHVYDRFANTIEKIPAILPGTTKRFAPLYFQELNNTTLLIAASQGLFQLNRKTRTISYYEPLRDIAYGLPVRQLALSATSLYCIQSGWFIRYDLQSGKIYRHKNEMLGNTMRNGLNITAIHIDRHNRIWVGASAGISLYNEADDSFRYFPFEETRVRAEGSYFMVLSIQEINNQLWVGTFNSGVWVMDLNNLDKPFIKVLNEKSGLRNNTVYATLPDKKGNIWMSTNSGISEYHTTQGYFTNYSMAEGLPQEEFNRLAYVACRNGEIAFGGINGVNVFNPNELTLPVYDFKPRLLSLTSVDDNNQEEYMSLLKTTTVQLPNARNEFEIQFVVPDYHEQRQYEVQYKLDGFDREWARAESNTFRYINVKPGAYTLHVQTTSMEGKTYRTSLALVINPPFYQTTWFMLLALGTVSLLVFTIIQSYARKTRSDKERLELLLQQRTREIEKSREELANLNEKKDLIFSILSHDLRSPLTTLKGFLTVLIDSVEVLSPHEIKKHAISIRNSVTSSLDLIDNTLFWSLSQTGNITYTPTSFSLNEMVNKITSLYQLTAEKKRIHLQTHAPADGIYIYGDENMVYVTLRNIVSNALKFTPEGKTINIELSRNHQLAQIAVTDEGIGMSQAYLQKLMSEEQLPLKKGTSNEKGTGLGIILCKKFVQMNNGYLEINSSENKGTEFIVKLPLAKATA